MVFSLHLSFHMGKLFTCCLPVPLFKALFILCHLILTTNPWRHGIVSTFQIRGARGPRSSSNFPLWPARPVPLAFWQQDRSPRRVSKAGAGTLKAKVHSSAGAWAEKCWRQDQNNNPAYWVSVCQAWGKCLPYCLCDYLKNASLLIVWWMRAQTDSTS